MFQVLKRHFARYTPKMVEQACGVPPEVFTRVCELVTGNSGPERTTAFVYSVGWTQHAVGAQYIRTAAILQLLLGNIGRPGGGILALRGHASIQGSTDIPTLFDLLPGFLTAGALAGALLGRRSRAISALSGASLLAASALTRFGIFEAGVASARDPKYTIVPQRQTGRHRG